MEENRLDCDHVQHFSEIVPSLNHFEWPDNVTILANNLDIIYSIILKYYPGIKVIKNKFQKDH